MDQGADTAREDAQISRDLILENNDTISQKTADKLIRWGHSASGILLQNCLGIPAQLPFLVRQFSNGVQKAQNDGKSAQAQICRGLLYAGSSYAINTLLKGFRLTESQKRAVNTAIAEMSTDPLLLAAAEQAEGEALYPVVHTGIESLVPAVGDIIYYPGELSPLELRDCVHGYIAETIADYGVKINNAPDDYDGDPGLQVYQNTDRTEEADEDHSDERITGQQADSEYNGGGRSKTFVNDPFDDNGGLLPNVSYISGEYDYLYETDDLGRIERVNVEVLQATKRDRRIPQWEHNPPGKRPGVDHAGHIIADRFGGSNKLDNIVPLELKE